MHNEVIQPAYLHLDFWVWHKRQSNLKNTLNVVGGWRRNTFKESYDI
ncbi:hypothetical protein N483_09165 [Pseudoalteromonas luteoviolacea NCIMB 1944]|nr:hypothetical protein N483_09165 [Pseudoalteromonas luteoviolacea NCIMB 1944]